MQKRNTRFNSLLDVVNIFSTEKLCREYLEQIRWQGKIVCQKCGSNEKIYKINDGKLYKCAKCRKQFTVRIGTIFEDSPLPLQKWMMALYLITAHKKGISSLQLSKDIDVTQDTAWFMLHRIRYAIKRKSFEKPLSGIVEADETYVGGKVNNKSLYKRKQILHRTSPLVKTPVFGMVQRDGEVHTQVIPDVKSKTVVGIINEMTAPETTMVTDSFRIYSPLKKSREHHVINHEQYVYVDGIYHTNTIEGFWSLLKRGIIGIYHQVSPKHLHRYCDEFTYRYNTRKTTDVQRFNHTLTQLSGRLTYKDLTNNNR